MKPAPAFDCALCGQRIGTTRTHYVRPDQTVVCVGCVDSRKLWDEITRHGTRAGIAAALGMWP